MVIRVLTAAVASALLAGCVSVGPNYQAPPAQPVVLQGAAAPVFSTTSPVASWWAQFDDPVLEQLVHDALGDNLDLRIAMARVREARAVFVEQRLDQLPHVTRRRQL
jgi:outer membrane protein, multidrug efflux system